MLLCDKRTGQSKEDRIREGILGTKELDRIISLGSYDTNVSNMFAHLHQILITKNRIVLAS